MTKNWIAAALVAALLPAAHAGTYHERFDDGLAQGWQPQDATAWSILPSAAGNLHLRGQAAPDATQVASQVTTFKRTFGDFGYAVTVADNAVRPTYVLARATADFSMRYDTSTGHTTYTGSGYAFGIGCSPFVYKVAYAYKVVDGVATVIQPWKAMSGMGCTGDITTGDRLEVRLQGATIQFYVNRQRVMSWTDPSPILSGRVGLYGVTDTAQPTWSDFDDVVVKPITTTLQPASSALPAATASATGPAADAMGRPLQAR